MHEDPNRKTLRQFQCRDYLWELFEQLSGELECSVDYLVNEAMRHYAKKEGKLRQTVAPPAGNGARNVGAASPVPQPLPANPHAQPRMTPNNPVGGYNPGGNRPAMANPSMAHNGRPQPPAQPAHLGHPGHPGHPPHPAHPAQAQGYGQPARVQPAQPSQGYPATQQPRQVQGYGAVSQAQAQVLYAIFEGQKYPVNKDEFFIGRSNKSCDLIVKDPNVSRQHARIVRHQGAFWMVDLGSTNGIEFQGVRVDQPRPIHEGDSFRICDHEIMFTYQ